MRQSMGIKECKKCGSAFLTDLRGGAKWCFPCKAVIKAEHKRLSRTVVKERVYAEAR